MSTSDQDQHAHRGVYVDTFARVVRRGGLVIPWQHREVLAKRGSGSEVVVIKSRPHPHLTCFAVTDRAEMDACLGSLRAAPPGHEATEPFMATLSVDRRGRIQLPEEFLRYAGLPADGNVTILGCLDGFEIWTPAMLEREAAARPPDMGQDDIYCGGSDRAERA